MFGMVFDAFSVLLMPMNLLAVAAGMVSGIIVGALPGLTATMAVALLVPVTFSINPITSLAMLGGVYCGGIYGGSISSILLATPGTPAAAATAIDGHPMAQNGEAGKALGIATISSFFGGITSAVALLFISTWLVQFALKFGPSEYFFLAVLGLTTIVTLSTDSLIKGLISGIFGLLIATIGMDPISAFPRFTFGNVNLLSGVPFMPAMIGLFSVSQVLKLIRKGGTISNSADDVKIGKIMPTMKEFKNLLPTILKGSGMGTVIGILPGAGSTIASFISYNEAKRSGKKTDKFGKGEPKGVAATESANNGVTGGSLIPLLTLGIPGNSVAAVLLGGLMIQGLIPGPDLFTLYGDITYAFIVSLFISNIFMLVIGLAGAKYFARVTNVSNKILVPIILVLSVIGSFAIQNSVFDIWLMFGFGMLGFVLNFLGFSSSPIVLALILGPIAEKGFTRSMVLSGGGWGIFFSNPISLVLIALSVIALIPPIVRYIKDRKKISERQY